MEEVRIFTPFIRLDSFLKFAGLCETGGEAKAVIQSGEVLLNGTCCTQRGKKLVPGDKVQWGEKTVLVAAGDPE